MRSETPKASRGRDNGEGCFFPIRLGSLGSVVIPPAGSGAANLVYNEDLKTHLVTIFCNYEHASNMHALRAKRTGATCVVCLHEYILPR